MEHDMSEVLEGAVCGVDGCTPAALDHFGPASGAKATLAIEVISDAICPWCWVAKRRLDSAIAALAPDATASVTWRPFELNPEMPKTGVNRRAYRSARFGSWQHSQALDAQVAAAGRLEGLMFNHDKMERTPNTVDAHRLIWLVHQPRRYQQLRNAVASASQCGMWAEATNGALRALVQHANGFTSRLAMKSPLPHLDPRGRHRFLSFELRCIPWFRTTSLLA
jgi:hypothetical protein